MAVYGDRSRRSRTPAKKDFYLGPSISGPGEGIVIRAGDPSADSEADAHLYELVSGVGTNMIWRGKRI
jgi:hypothetical protein